jgi:cyclophilin family peptidyl-prolyl cis-trans isomerase
MSIVSRRRSRRLAAAAAAAIVPPARRAVAEPLEGRQLFAAQVVGTLADATGGTGATQTTDLRTVFDDPAVNRVVRLNTSAGVVDIETFDSSVRLNAANFARYAASGRYNGSVFHRAIADFVLQGGSFLANGTEIPDYPPVVSEPNGTQPAGFTSNIRGTVCFARLPAFNDANGNGVQDAGEASIPGGGPNSATGGFFVNLGDNGSNLDVQNGGFTVLGRVLGDGMNVVDALTTTAISNPTAALVNTATVTEDLTYSVVSSNPSAVTATIANNGELNLNYVGTSGASTITVTATSLDGTTSVQSAFDASVGLTVTLGGATGNKTAQYTDADGTVTTVALKGSGSAALSFDGSNLAQTGTGKVSVTGTIAGLTSVAVTGSDTSTAVTISSRGGDGVSTVAGLSTDGAVKSITAKDARLTGPLTVAGTVGTVTIGEALNASLTLGGSSADKPMTLAFDSLTDSAITSGAPIKSLKVGSAANADATVDEAITAPSISTITSSGNFGTNVTIPGEGNLNSLKVGGELTGDVTAHSIGTITVGQNVSGSVITATHGAGEGDNVPGLKTLTVKGGLAGATINSAGDVRSVSAGSITGGTRIIAGAPALATTFPTSTADLTQPAEIGSVKVKTSYTGSVLVATVIRTVKLGTLTLANGGVPFGFAADKIGTISGRTDANQKFALRSPNDQAAANNQLSDLSLADATFLVL